jgi:hypothetical protein
MIYNNLEEGTCVPLKNYQQICLKIHVCRKGRKKLAKTAGHAHGIRTAPHTQVQVLPLHQPVMQQ